MPQDLTVAIVAVAVSTLELNGRTVHQSDRRGQPSEAQELHVCVRSESKVSEGCREVIS